MLDWIREHPYLAGSLAVGGVILFVMLRSGGSSASSGGGSYGPSESLQAAQIGAGTQLQMATIMGQVQVAEFNAQVNMAELLTAADVEKTRIARDVALEDIWANRDLGFRQTDAALTLGLAQLGGMRPFVTSPNMPAPVVSGGIGSVPPPPSNTQMWAALPAGGNAAYRVGSGGPGLDQHGVDVQLCGPLDGGVCAAANTAALQASYDANRGSYLQGNVYAGTREAWEIYGDPRVSYEAHLRGDYRV